MYEGTFVDGFKEGLGTYCFADGSKYQGTFVKNAMEGRPWHGYKVAFLRPERRGHLSDKNSKAVAAL